MPEVRFYQTRSRKLDGDLSDILNKSLQRSWRVVVQCASPERVEALDAWLWSFEDDGFLPHGPDGDQWASEQPILLTSGEGNTNAANVRVLLDGIPVPEDVDRYSRVVLLFDGEDEDALAQARREWTSVKAKGLAPSYWMITEEGRWVQQGGGSS